MRSQGSIGLLEAGASIACGTNPWKRVSIMTIGPAIAKPEALEKQARIRGIAKRFSFWKGVRRSTAWTLLIHAYALSSGTACLTAAKCG